MEQQIKGDKRFLEEQATEREGEREEFNKRIEHLEEIIKRKEKEEDKEISLVATNKVHKRLITNPLHPSHMDSIFNVLLLQFIANTS